jgi:ABC-2 type transport system ATP-binding protein
MVEIRHLRKEYKDTVAVKDLSLQLDRGDIFGFIGPNGAGKTTTIRMLATLITPTAGTALLDGVDVVQEPERIRAIVGYMPDFFGVYDDIKVWEYLDFFAAAYRIPRDRRPQIIDDVLGLTDLNIKKDAYVESLSRGMKQRLCLAKTLVHDPRVMLLDEPASGLDPRARIEIRELLLELRAMGKTIIVSSHILPEMEEFCNKIGIIEQGELIIAGDVRTIARHLRGAPVVEVGLVESLDRAEAILVDMSDLAAEVKRLDGTHRATEAEAEARRAEPPSGTPVHSALRFSYIGPPDEEYRVLAALVQAGVKVRSFHAHETDLEDVFLSVTRGQVA